MSVQFYTAIHVVMKTNKHGQSWPIAAFAILSEAIAERDELAQNGVESDTTYTVEQIDFYQ